MLTRLRNRVQGQEGFTLIELLVVILIIGILAAVAIPAFLNQRGKAQDAAVKADINTAQTAEETYYTDNQAYVAASNTPAGSYTGLTNIEPTLKNAFTGAEGLAVTVSGSPTANAYSISGTSTSNISYTFAKAADGTVTRSCTVPANTNPAGCKGATQGAVASNGSW
jgi:type IV pilus assembly protein PilA